MHRLLLSALVIATSACAAAPEEEVGGAEAAASGASFAAGVYDTDDGSAVVYRREGRTLFVMATASGTCSGELATQLFTVRVSVVDERTRCRLELWPHVLSGGLGLRGELAGSVIDRTFVPRADGALDGVYGSATPGGTSLEVTGSAKHVGPLRLALGAADRTIEATATPRPLAGGHVQPTHFDVRTGACELLLVTSRERGAFALRLTASADAPSECRSLASGEVLRPTP